MVGYSLEQVPHIVRTNVVQTSKLGDGITASGKLLSKLFDLLVCKKSATNLLALQLVVAAFLLAIRHVVIVGASKQVIRIATRWVIALVQNVQAVWDWAVVQFVGKAMGADLVSFAINLARQDAISIAVVVPSPKPTLGIFALVYMLPKAFFECLPWPNVVVMTNDKSPWLTLDVAAWRVRVFGDWCGLTASTFAKLWGDLLCVHKGNFITNYTCRTWQMVDSFRVPAQIVLLR